MSPSPEHSEPFERTLERAARGDESAWRTIVDLYYARVFGLIKAHCSDPDLAEEITQSTFCTIASKLRAYEEQGKFESWLFHIAMNRLRDEMRRRKRHAASTDEQALQGLAAAPMGTGGTESAEALGGVDPETREKLRLALARLSESDQITIHLRHVAGLSFARIAEVLGQPIGTVLARHHRALRKLKELLEQAGGDGGMG
jgi:RNA polymerase sigma-70 factor (ECF subfamily)